MQTGYKLALSVALLNHNIQHDPWTPSDMYRCLYPEIIMHEVCDANGAVRYSHEYNEERVV